MRAVLGASFGDWADTLNARGLFPTLKREVEFASLDSHERLKELGLPRYQRRIIALSKFLECPKGYLDRWPSPRYYVSLFGAPGSQLRRYRQMGLTGDEVQDFVAAHIKKHDTGSYRILLQEDYDNVYGGNILTSGCGRVYLEAVRGNQRDVDSGTRTPDFIVTRNEFLRTFKYSFPDPQLRKMLLDVVLCLPHWGSGRDVEILPGYYAFVLVNRTGSGLTPVFLDTHAGSLFSF